jgi:hypothetical protein
MEDYKETLIVNVTVEITAESLETIVENAKNMTGPDENEHYTVDTADMVGDMISKFLMEKKFETYVKDPSNYPVISND